MPVFIILHFFKNIKSFLHQDQSIGFKTNINIQARLKMPRFNDLLQKSTLSVLRRHFKLHLTHKAINSFWCIYVIIFCSLTPNVIKMLLTSKFVK